MAAALANQDCVSISDKLRSTLGLWKYLLLPLKFL